MKTILFIAAMAITSILEGRQVMYVDDVKGIIADKILECEYCLRVIEDSPESIAYFNAQLHCANEIYIRLNDLLTEKY